MGFPQLVLQFKYGIRFADAAGKVVAYCHNAKQCRLSVQRDDRIINIKRHQPLEIFLLVIASPFTTLGRNLGLEVRDRLSACQEAH